MSSRVLKKLQGGPEKDLMMVDAHNSIDELSEDDDELDTARGRGGGTHLNPFDLLNQQSFSESEVKEDDNETEHASASASVAAGGNVAAPAVAKKKKKKRKKKSKYTGNHISSEDNELNDKYLSDKDSLLSGGKSGSGHGHGHGHKVSFLAPPRIELDKSLLAVELKHLNAHNEMRRTFGKRVVKMENKRGRQKLTLKSTYMVTAKESWPPLTKSIITMKPTAPPESVSTAAGATSGTVAATSGKLSDITNVLPLKPYDNVQWFAFEHSQYYQSVQNLFLPAMERTDSDFLINLIHRCPYHVDSLIQLSELCKMTEDFVLASELIERAVLVLESALHPSFSLTSGNCRLDYRRQENRSIFIALFKHAQYLEGRACCRTAFELSKLILSFNPDVDPLAIVLVIDYYALRSKQYNWFIKFYEEFDTARNLAQLPNMAYSYALALFCALGECEKADKALEYALLMFPGVLRPLLEELGLQTVERVLTNSYFNPDVSANQSPALHQLVCLYICRAKVIWRQSNVHSWLERNINIALERVERKEETVTEYGQKRAVRYVAPPRPILRHVILSDFREKVPLGPFVANEKDPIVIYDPLPPLDSVNFYEKSSSSSPTAANPHSLSMFFQSLLPTFNVNNAGVGGGGGGGGGVGEHPQLQAHAAGDGGGAGVGGANAAFNRRNAAVAAAAVNEVVQVDRQLQALNMNLENAAAEGAAAGIEMGATYRELTHSLTSIVDAMRDFLQNFRIAEYLPPADGERNTSTDEDTSDYFD